MKKLARKIFIALFTAVFALVTLGATTFAWFTLTTTVEIQSFGSKITSGTGIEVSLDGQDFKSYISTDEILSRIKVRNGFGDEIVLDAITSNNGYDFNVLDISEAHKPFEGDNQPTKETILGDLGGNKYIEFELYFRTPTPASDSDDSTWVYLLDNTKISSVGVLWISDATFKDTASTTLVPGGEKTIFAANCLRMSFQTYNLNPLIASGSNTAFGSAQNDAVVIYELDPDENNLRLDDELKEYGSIDYFRAKSGALERDLREFYKTGVDEDENPIYDYTDILPVVLNNDNLVSSSALGEGSMEGKAAIVELVTDSTDGYTYGAVMVRMWIEGWDPDCYNAIMAADLSINLNFGGSTKEPGLPVQEENGEGEGEGD